jgi:hypothetical protein
VVGVELAGELAVKYAKTEEKKVAVCVRGDKLLSNLNPKAGVLASNFLRQHNV